MIPFYLSWPAYKCYCKWFLTYESICFMKCFEAVLELRVKSLPNWKEKGILHDLLIWPLILWYRANYCFELYICIFDLLLVGFSSLSGVSYNSPNFSRFVGIVLRFYCSLSPQQQDQGQAAPYLKPLSLRTSQHIEVQKSLLQGFYLRYVLIQN